MTVDRRTIAVTLFTAAVMGIGFATGVPILASIVGGISVNIAADLIQVGWGQACRRLLGESGLLNHDLQGALARALGQAIDRLERAWWQTPRGAQMRQAKDKEERDCAEGVFKLLREDAAAFCTPDCLGRAAGNEQVRQLLYGDEPAVRRRLSEQLAAYLYGHDPQLIAFIEANLVRELAFCFGEELKADRPESNRAWRAFQRLLLEGLQAGVADVQARAAELRAGQAEILAMLADLRAWATRMDARLPEVREPTGQGGLEKALADLSRQMAAGFAQVQAGLVELPERIRPIAREEMRRAMAMIVGRYRLKEEVKPSPRPFCDLPSRVQGFVGRVGEVQDIKTALQEGTSVILWGVPGIGKTAVARQVANDILDAGIAVDGALSLGLTSSLITA